MNSLIKQAGLLLIGLIGLVMLIVGFSSDSPSNGFLATTAIICYASAHYDSSKWLKFRDPDSTDGTVPWT